MPPVFQIVSRVSGKALTNFEGGGNIEQWTQNAQDPTQMWILAPQSFGNFLIQPFGSPDLAIGMPDGTESQGWPLILKPAGAGAL
ncbi:MAG: RICIN domain-containing protein [Solirubrobacteraceae bacterium]